MPFPIVPLIAAAPSIFQGLTGLFQGNRGRRELDSLQRPTYEIPREVDMMLQLAQANYSDPYTQSELNARRDIGLAGANAVTQGRDSGNLGGMLPAIVSAQSQGYNRLSEMAEATKERQRGMLTDMLGLKAKYRDTEWQINEFAPYMDKYNEAREQIGAGQQNVFSALDSLSALGVQAASLANARNSQVSPSQAAQYTSSQTGSAAMMQQLLQGTTDTMSWPGQQGVQNKYANQFMQGLGLLNKVWK